MKAQVDYRRGKHCVTNIHVHLVFVLKYRRRVITPKVLEKLKAIFESVTTDLGAILKECNGEADHVHLLVEYPPKLSISTLVNSLKGVSSRLIRKEKFPEVSRALWGEHLWSPSYFASSCGGAPIEVLRRYIQEQQDAIPAALPPP
jgi:putative transposase